MYYRLTRFEEEWIRLALKNGISERKRDDVNRCAIDLDLLEQYIETIGLHLYVSGSHYILCTSLVEVYC